MSRFTARHARTPLLTLVTALAAGLPLAALPPAAFARAGAEPAGGVAKGATRANPPVFFAYTRSDIAPDPGARFGRLANGMTYIVYKNATPPGTAAISMRVNAGSLMEREDQRGLAHFIEHMVFKGSTHVPEGEMIKILERNGLAFGADTNASTSHNETAYTLKLPNVKQETIDASMFLLREAAGNVLFDPAAVHRERGVVLGEERYRGGAQSRVEEEDARLMFPGQKYPDRFPIGLPEVIRTAPPQALIDFYNNFYRPEYTTLVVVGDIDPDRIESDIKARFSDWTGKPQSKDALTDFGVYKPKGERVRTHAEKGLTDRMSINWFKPYVARIQTRRSDFEDLLKQIASDIVGRRFDRQAHGAAAAFSAAGFGEEVIPYTARAYELGIRAKPGQDKAALEQVLATLQQFRAQGVTPAELDRERVALRSRYEATVAGQGTRPTEQILGSLLGSLGSFSVPTTPAQDLAAFEAMQPKLTLAAVNAFIRKMDLGDGPVIVRQAEDTRDFDQAQIRSTYRTALQQPVAPYVEPGAATWAYTDFGPPGQVVERSALPGLGVTRVRFANGVRLNLKATQFEKNSVQIQVALAGGKFALTPDQAIVVQAASRVSLREGGLGKLTPDDLRDALNGKQVAVGFRIGDNASELSGYCTTADLATQMQLLMAFQTDAAFRPEALERMKSSLPNSYVQRKTSPTGVFVEKAAPLLYGNEPFHREPTEQELMAVKNDDLKALVQNILATSPIEITMVGDVSEDEAIRQVAATFGTLPERPEARSPLVSDKARFPTEGLRWMFTHEGRADQNLSFIGWPTTDYFSDPKLTMGLAVLSAVMTQREIDEIRSRQGASYGAGASNSGSTTYLGFGYLGTNAQVKPEADETYFQTVSGIAEDLKNKPPTDDELLRAKAPILEQLTNAPNRNWYWMAVLNQSVRDPRFLEFEPRHRALLEAVTADDVQALARTYLDMGKALRIQVKAASLNDVKTGSAAASTSPAASTAAR